MRINFGHVSNETLQEDEYNYLGQVLSADPKHEEEIRHRIGMDYGAISKHPKILKSMLPLSLKRRIYNQCVLPAMTYGAETWRLTEQLENKLRSAQRATEREIIGVTLMAWKRAFWIRERTRAEDIIVQIKKKKWAWAGRVVERTTGVTEWIPRDGSTRRGRPIARWRDEIRKFVAKNGVELRRTAADV